MECEGGQRLQRPFMGTYASLAAPMRASARMNMGVSLGEQERFMQSKCSENTRRGEGGGKRKE